MHHLKHLRTIGLVAGVTVMASANSNAQEIKKVFVIAMENHN